MIRDTSAQDRQVAGKAKGKKSILAAGALAAIAVGVYLSIGGFNATASVSRDSIRTATVARGVFERAVNATGRVVASHSPTLYSAAAGRVVFFKKPGAEVSKGEVVAEVHSPELENQWQQEKNKLQSAELELERMRLDVRQKKLALKKELDLRWVEHLAAKRELKRATASFAIKVISEFDFEKAKDNRLTAQLNLENAEKESRIRSEMIDFELKTNKIAMQRQQLVVDDISRRMKELTLRSPVAGIIGNWMKEQDNKVNNNESLLTVIDLSAYEGELDIPQSFADELAIGMSATIRIGSDKYQGELRSVSPEVEDNIVKARVVFSQEGIKGLRQNQHLSVRLLLESKPNTLFVNRGAYLQAGDEAYVIQDGVANRQPIKIGSRGLDKIEVLSGLKSGDEIIVSSTSEFKEHNTIFIQE